MIIHAIQANVELEVGINVQRERLADEIVLREAWDLNSGWEL